VTVSSRLLKGRLILTEFAVPAPTRDLVFSAPLALASTTFTVYNSMTRGILLGKGGVTVSYIPIEPESRGDRPRTGGPLFSVVVAFLLGLFAGIAAPLAVDYLKPALPVADIAIDFEPRPPFVVRAGLEPGAVQKQSPAYLLRIAIENRSQRVTARACSVMLTGLWDQFKERQFKATEPFDPVLLNWLPYMPADIRPGIKVFAPFGEIVPQGALAGTAGGASLRAMERAEFRFRATAWPPWRGRTLSPGKHRIRLTVAFEDMPPVEQLLEIDWSGRWSDDPREMMRLVRVNKKT
jgi:hypothetical protein